jgi:hypothetical protein
MFRWERNGEILALAFVAGEQSAFDESALSHRPDRAEFMPLIQRLMERTEQKSRTEAERFLQLLNANGITPPTLPPAMTLPIVPTPPPEEEFNERQQFSPISAWDAARGDEPAPPPQTALPEVDPRVPDTPMILHPAPPAEHEGHLGEEIALATIIYA